MTANTDVWPRVCVCVCVAYRGASRDSAFLCTTRPRAIATAIYSLLCCRGDCVYVCV